MGIVDSMQKIRPKVNIKLPQCDRSINTPRLRSLAEPVNSLNFIVPLHYSDYLFFLNAHRTAELLIHYHITLVPP